MSNDTEVLGNPESQVNTDVTPVETSSEGTQPSEAVTPSPVPEKQVSDHIPYSRFSEVVQDRNALREQNARMLAILEQQGRAQAPAAPQPQAPEAPKQEDFQTYEDYIDARAAFRAEQAAEKKFNDWQSKQQTQQQTQQAEYQKQVRLSTAFTEMNNAAKSFAGWEKVPTEPLFALGEELFLTAFETKNPALAAQIANTPGLSQQLARMPLEQAKREIWRMDGKLLGSTGQPPKKPSGGIPVIDPVGTGNKKGLADVYNEKSSEQDYIAATRPIRR